MLLAATLSLQAGTQCVGSDSSAHLSPALRRREARLLSVTKLTCPRLRARC
jgi:hypothetical protein